MLQLLHGITVATLVTREGKLQALVYDILLEEGAGKRCGECDRKACVKTCISGVSRLVMPAEVVTPTEIRDHVGRNSKDQWLQVENDCRLDLKIKIHLGTHSYTQTHTQTHTHHIHTSK